jgi:hypothetical protein
MSELDLQPRELTFVSQDGQRRATINSDGLVIEGPNKSKLRVGLDAQGTPAIMVTGGKDGMTVYITAKDAAGAYVLDSKGKARAGLSLQSGGPNLVLINESSTDPTVMLGVNDNDHSASLNLSYGNGQTGIMAKVVSDENRSFVATGDDGGHPRGILGFREEEPYFVFLGVDGKPTRVIKPDPGIPGGAKNDISPGTNVHPDSREPSHWASILKVAWGMGSALAISISWDACHSILWTTLHGLLSWGYVIYYAISH